MKENRFDEEKRALRERLKSVMDQVHNQMVKSNRSIDDLRVMAVTKTIDPEIINEAIHQGIALLGENRAQELLEKYEIYDKQGVDIHFIGHLQTNKVRQIADKVCMIESVDSLKLASEIDKEMAKRDSVMEILVEVNIGGEQSKSGIAKEMTEQLLEQISSMRHLRVRGLMTIPPVCEKKEQVLRYFEDMYRLFVDIRAKNMDNIDMSYLSMGMSGDYLEAIQCGANIIRLGTALFGRRSRPVNV
ncbi:YggS family pyridoxal phosphate-dependent enzyme [Candidatus Soleaferrea massiliensis]|uniref:YggS family pyridoxal phosphate-dependent enzyme n=1 Tax=Candidatus Soleaferrea massiliensis TaxID=1470354 RepID=UPI0006944E74|nr:YggS family pyridoxal phosphate-dependent enzyme [Candidatus Soleaferrea massiliensis]